MKQHVREILVTAKVAQTWDDHFNERVEELMSLVNKIDTDKQILESGELLDIYRKNKMKASRIRRKKIGNSADKPFEFLVFCN